MQLWTIYFGRFISASAPLPIPDRFVGSSGDENENGNGNVEDRSHDADPRLGKPRHRQQSELVIRFGAVLVKRVDDDDDDDDDQSSFNADAVDGDGQNKAEVKTSSNIKRIGSEARIERVDWTVRSVEEAERIFGFLPRNEEIDRGEEEVHERRKRRVEVVCCCDGRGEGENGFFLPGFIGEELFFFPLSSDSSVVLCYRFMILSCFDCMVIFPRM